MRRLFGSLKVERLHGMHFATLRREKTMRSIGCGFYNHRSCIRRWDISAQWPSRKCDFPTKKGSPRNRSARGDAKRGHGQPAMIAKGKVVTFGASEILKKKNQTIGL
jgi:hypothetical protein